MPKLVTDGAIKTLVDNINNLFGAVNRDLYALRDAMESMGGGLASGQVLWTGRNALGAGVTIQPSIPLDQCQNGWILYWENASGATRQIISQTLIHKSAEVRQHTEIQPQATTIGSLAATNAMAIKRVDWSNTHIFGIAANTSGNNGTRALWQVQAW